MQGIRNGNVFPSNPTNAVLEFHTEGHLDSYGILDENILLPRFPPQKTPIPCKVPTDFPTSDDSIKAESLNIRC